MLDMQGWGTGGLSFFETIYKAAVWRAADVAKQPASRDASSPVSNPAMQGGLVTTISDLHHEHHTARPELYIPKVRSACVRQCSRTAFQLSKWKVDMYSTQQ